MEAADTGQRGSTSGERIRGSGVRTWGGPRCGASGGGAQSGSGRRVVCGGTPSPEAYAVVEHVS
ncbi:hypothetical protein C1708_15550 [Streptomyces sp. DH-12]|nr:hypothetical protein C1708_15550 [Streptomyces sp. DH-12]